MTSPPDRLTPPTPTAQQRMVGAGCLLTLIALVVFVVALVLRPSGEDGGPWQVVAVVAAVVAVLGFVGLAVVGMLMRRRAVRELGQFENLPDASVDVEAVREIERCRLPHLARAPRFPEGVISSKELPAGADRAWLMINNPPLSLRGERPVEPSASYVWVRVPLLPTLVVTTDSRAQQAVLGRDLGIESDQFNTRFRVQRTGTGHDTRSAAVDAEFTRYASAMLHPRAAQCLLRLPANVGVYLSGGYLGTADRVDTTLERAQLIADILAELAGLIPAHVISRWGGQRDYRPSD